MRMSPRTATLSLVLGAAALAGGCGDGDETPSSALPDAPAALRLASPSFDDGAALPKRFTCDGEGVSPPLAVSDPPAKTRELALVVEDPDADGFVHWMMLRIPPETALIGEGRVPRGAVEIENGFGDRGWGGPCPPEGDEPHRYVFAMYALDAPLGLKKDPSPDEVHEALAEHALARGTLRGRFGR